MVIVGSLLKIYQLQISGMTLKACYHWAVTALMFLLYVRRSAPVTTATHSQVIVFRRVLIEFPL